MGEENSALGIPMRLFQNPEIEELEETVDAMRKELIRLRWKAEALETAVAVLAGLAGAFLVTAVRLLLR